MHNRCTCLHACFCFSFGSTQLFILLDATYSGLLAIHVFTQGEAWWLKEHSAPFGANINAFDAAIFDCCSRLTFAPLPRWRWLRLQREDVDGGFINPLTLRLRHEGVDPAQLDFVVVEPYPHLVALPSPPVPGDHRASSKSFPVASACSMVQKHSKCDEA